MTVNIETEKWVEKKDHYYENNAEILNKILAHGVQ